ncbi:MAG: NAD(P)/FAD-dependent oxidoreductase [Proteobacteria bacterium]|nr:NAD(P)/FAD-dependent oxidoreductase [Pseudomonadota bacterium]MBS0463654.1 NAD(P)/FAD-dependent oxidoreductase [Pseudomonadota bacterium]
MSVHPYDALIIGAGHNGLVAANYLAKAGKKVLVLERRDVAGGQLARHVFGDGFAVDPIHPGGLLRPDIIADLGLGKFGFDGKPAARAPYIALLPGGQRLHLVAAGNDAATLESIRTLSAKDAQAWPAFVNFMDKAAAFLDAAYRTAMPRLPNVNFRREGLPLAKLGWTLRRLGGRDMFGVIRTLSMSLVAFTQEWFESEPLRAAIAAVGIHGHTLGSMSAGGGFTLIHNWRNRGGLAHAPVAGGTARIADTLVAALQARGGQVRCGAAVTRVLVDKQRATGVQLTSGERIAAKAVLCDADPRHALLELVGARELPPEFVWATQSIRMRGAVAKVHLRTDGRHGIPEGTLAHAPTLKYLERAFDASKYGEISAAPYLEITTDADIVSVHFQFAPYTLRGATWAEQRGPLERLAVATLAEHFPALPASIRQIASILPTDLESTWGLTEGDLNHGQLQIDQMFFMRPIPGWSNHRTPIDGLWLCGSGVHGGGGISGASGRNAARAALGASSR